MCINLSALRSSFPPAFSCFHLRATLYWKTRFVFILVWACKQQFPLFWMKTWLIYLHLDYFILTLDIKFFSESYFLSTLYAYHSIISLLSLFLVKCWLSFATLSKAVCFLFLWICCRFFKNKKLGKEEKRDDWKPHCMSRENVKVNCSQSLVFSSLYWGLCSVGCWNPISSLAPLSS